MDKPIMLNHGEGNSYWVLGDLYTFKVTGKETGGAFTVNYTRGVRLKRANQNTVHVSPIELITRSPVWFLFFLVKIMIEVITNK